jgi:hypothetical protein
VYNTTHAQSITHLGESGKKENKMTSATLDIGSLALKGAAYPTDRVLNGQKSWGDIVDGEEYDFEMAQDAVDAANNKCRIYYIYQNIKGEDGKQLDDYSYADGDVSRIEIL